MEREDDNKDTILIANKEGKEKGRRKVTREEAQAHQTENIPDAAQRAEQLREEHRAEKAANTELIKQEVYKILEDDLDSQTSEAQEIVREIMNDRTEHESQSLFQSLNGEMERLYDLDKVRYKDVIEKLKKARDKLYTEASNRKLLENLKKETKEVPLTDNSTKNEGRYNKINKDWHENQITSPSDSSSDFSGIAEAYIDVAKLVAQEAYLRVLLEQTEIENKDAIKDQIKKLQDRIKVFSMGGVPTDKAQKIRDHLISKRGGTSAAPPGVDTRETMFPQSSQLLGKRIGAALASKDGGGSSIEVLARHTGALKSNSGIDKVDRYEHIFEIFDIQKEEDLRKWLERNVSAFTGESGDSPAKTYLQHINYYVDYDLGTAFQLFRTALLDKNKDNPDGLAEARKEIKRVKEMTDKIEKELIARISVHAAYDAMKNSGGSYTKFATFMTMGNERGPNLDNLDEGLKKYLLTDNPEYWWMTLGGTIEVKKDKDGNTIKDKNGNEIKIYHDPTPENSITCDKLTKIQTAMGIDPVPMHYDEKKKIWVRSDFDSINIVDEKRTRELVEALGTEGKRFKGYIEDRLDEEEAANEKARKKGETLPHKGTREERELAWKNAMALLITDGQFTTWIYRLKNENKKLGDKFYKDYHIKINDIKPDDDWGGDPLTGFIDPTVLPEDIKKMYDNPGDDEIMRMADKAWRPTDIVKGNRLVGATLLGPGMKSTTRLADAMFKIWGSSRAKGLPDFGRDGASALEEALELLDQVYGEGTFETIYGDEITGKELVGIMMARLLATKARAAVNESAPPRFLDRTFGKFAEPPEAKFMPNAEALMFLLGPNLDGRAGFISKMMGSRTRLSFRGTWTGELMDRVLGDDLYRYQANTYIREAVGLLKSNDQSEAWRRIGEAFNVLGLTFNLAGLYSRKAMEMAGIEVAPRRK